MTLIDRITKAQPEEQREPDNLDAIIARMSEAQRAAVIDAQDMHHSHGGYPFLAVRFTQPWNDPVAEFLTLKADRLTPLGLAVHARLKENTNGN